MKEKQNDPVSEFFEERRRDIEKMGQDEELRALSLDWMVKADKYKYTYNYTWMGRPIIKFPSDIVAQQEIMWRTRPDLIIETGIAHGGSIVFSASMQQMMGIENAEVVAVDIDIRAHNRDEIESHPMFSNITMYEGDSTSDELVEKVRKHTEGKKSVMVILDSNHTEEHVYRELLKYADFVTPGNYLLLPDTFIEFFPKGYYDNRPWDVGDNPHSAMKRFIAEREDFQIDKAMTSKLMICEGIDGYLQRIDHAE